MRLIIGFTLGICASAAIAQSVPVFTGDRATYAAGLGPNGFAGIRLDANERVIAKCESD